MIRTLIAATSLVSIAAPALAQDAAETERLEERAEQIVSVMRGDASYESVFTQNFTGSVPEAQFLAITGQIESQFGPLIGVDAVDPQSATLANISIRFERGLASGPFRLENAEPFNVDGLLLRNFEPVGDNPEDLVTSISELPGETSLIVARLGAEGETLAAHNADQHFAIGSTFKLYVLSALAHSVELGERSWDDVTPLTVRSFPSGQMQDWPDGSPVTLHTLATLMISNSDNTATDQLMAVLGRDAVEAELIAANHSAPEATLPFLTTRELFMIKSAPQEEAVQYRNADIDGRRAALAALEGADRSLEDISAAFAGGPNMIDLEWFASPNDIAALMQRLASFEDDTALEIMSVNQAMTPDMAEHWDYAGYKGGSEPGVLNLSWLLRDDAGDWSVVSMSWNNPEDSVDQQAFEILGMRAISLAAGN